MEERNNFLNVEQKFCVNLPFFYVDTIIDPISFIGNLNKSHGIKNYSTYICLNNCDIFYVDKTEIKDEYLFSQINNNVSDLVTHNLFKKHYLFKDVDIKFLERNYSKFFNIIKVKKDENIILQNSVYEGVFFISKGVLELKTKRSYNELNELKYNIMNNFTNLSNLGSSLESLRDKKRDTMMERLLRNPKFIKSANEVKEVNFGTLIDTEILGLFDLYDKNNGIYNFSVQCISNEAEAFFVPKEIFTSMLTNPDIEEKITKITTEKIKILKLKIKRFTDLFEVEFDKLSASVKEEKKYLNFNNLTASKNIFNKSKMASTKLIPGKLNFKLVPSKFNQKKLIRSESDSKFLKLKNRNYIRSINKDQESLILDKFINYNKRYNNMINNNEINPNFNISTNLSKISSKNNSKISIDSKFDDIKSIKNLYSNRVNHLFSHNNNNNINIMNNKKFHYSLSFVNIKSKSFNNKNIFNNINNTNIGRKRNFLNKHSNKINIKQFSEIGRKRAIRNLYNFTPSKSINKIYDETLVMPVLNNRYNNNTNFTFQDGYNEFKL